MELKYFTTFRAAVMVAVVAALRTGMVGAQAAQEDARMAANLPSYPAG